MVTKERSLARHSVLRSGLGHGLITSGVGESPGKIDDVPGFDHRIDFAGNPNRGPFMIGTESPHGLEVMRLLGGTPGR